MIIELLSDIVLTVDLLNVITLGVSTPEFHRRQT